MVVLEAFCRDNCKWYKLIYILPLYNTLMNLDDLYQCYITYIQCICYLTKC